MFSISDVNSFLDSSDQSNVSHQFNNDWSVQMGNSSGNETHDSFNADSTHNSTYNISYNRNTSRDSTDPMQDASGEAMQIGLDPESIVEIADGGAASTPRVTSQRTRRSNNIGQPIVDLVNISNIEATGRSRIRTARVGGRLPIIDLCTPPRVTGVINLSDNTGPLSSNVRRARRRPITEDVQVIDANDPDGPSPPRRSCDSYNMSMEDVYKCPICLDPVRRKDPCATRCGHVFCTECIKSAVRSTRKCPLCNKKITMRQLIRIYL